MRSVSLLVSVVLFAMASQASAQCYFIAPPTAPDMKNPGFYFMNPYGVIYGPNYCVLPPFPAYNGVLPVVNRGGGQGNGNGNGNHPMAQYASDPAAFNKAMQAYGQACERTQPYFGGFARHPFARSPRDYFMHETDPQVSPYNYGLTSGNRDCD